MNEFNLAQLNKYINLEKEYLKRNELLNKDKSKKKSFIELVNSIQYIENNIEKYFKKPIITYLSQKRSRLKKINHHKIKNVKKTLK
jgi:hypothetical protein